MAKNFFSVIKSDDIFHIPKFYLLSERRLASKAEETDFKRYNRTEFNVVEYSTETSPACTLLLVIPLFHFYLLLSALHSFCMIYSYLYICRKYPFNAVN